MSDIETIKARIRKLMAIAGDGVAPEGEIDNAMRLAAKLLDAHHLSQDDMAETPGDVDPELGQAFATSQATRFSTWEGILSHAISTLFGCVQTYSSNDTAPIRVNGIIQMKGDQARRGCRICFYGPAAESREAAELFEEWSRAIAAMGVARWGGCFRGEGAMYCYGFARALFAKANQINKERATVKAKAIGESTTAITLLNRYEILRTRGKDWLKKEKGIHLVSAGRGSGYSSGSSEAYEEGEAHGNAAEFGRSNRGRQISDQR